MLLIGKSFLKKWPKSSGHGVSVVISIRFRARAIFPGRRLPNACLAQPVRGRVQLLVRSLFTLEVRLLRLPRSIL